MLDLALHMLGYPQAVTAFGVAYADFGPERARTAFPLVEGSAATADVYDVEDFASGMITLATGRPSCRQADPIFRAICRDRGPIFASPSLSMSMGCSAATPRPPQDHP